MSNPTPKQLAYLTALIKRAGMTEDQWRDSVGLYEVSPWGRRLRTEAITRTAVSVWIDRLKASIEPVLTEMSASHLGACGGEFCPDGSCPKCRYWALQGGRVS